MKRISLRNPRNRERILVVEDDEVARETMTEVLAHAGYDVVAAADGYEALSIAAHGSPDLVLSDLQMPGIDGVELTKRLHAFAGGIPVVLTTGITDTQDVITAAQSYGAVACLPKPMNVDELLWTIDRTLAARPRAAARISASQL
ncbi:MAG TPA: response regulator [Polyangia bacterium]|jgi:CheY-like chemotaxis protein|nr:response regulator [Polyangia bacterium]